MIGDEHPGDTTWGVRWGEAGAPAVCREYGDEEQARAMHARLTRRYEELGRGDKPELIRAVLIWRTVQ